eukprot:COSAG04_NODE_454_length_14092_cov_330.378261_19_plen_140_part_00
MVSKLNSAVLGRSKGKGQNAAKGGAKDVTASASKKKKPAAVVVEETPSKRRRKKLYKPTFNTPAPSFEDVSDACFFFCASAVRCAGPLLFLFLSARLCRNLLSAKAFAVVTELLQTLLTQMRCQGGFSLFTDKNGRDCR